MARPLGEIEREALELPLRDRALLIERLLATLDSGEDEDAEEAWLAEAERRYQDYKAGKTTARPAAEVLEQAKRDLR